MRTTLTTWIGGLSLLLISNFGSTAMAKTRFSRGVKGPYKLRTTGEPRLIKQHGSIALSPARQRQLLNDLKEVGFQGDFMVTSDFRTFPSLFNKLALRPEY